MNPESIDVKSADYSRKSDLISELPESLLELGNVLATDRRLSITQGNLLLQKLYAHELLRVRDAFAALYDRILLRTTGAHLLIAHGLAVAAQLQDGRPVGQQVELTSQLLNASHLATRNVRIYEWQKDVERDVRPALDILASVESATFGQRERYAALLAVHSLASSAQIDDLANLDEDEFLASRYFVDRLYDHMISAHMLQSVFVAGMNERFQSMQDVIGVGFTMGIRDAKSADERLA